MSFRSLVPERRFIGCIGSRIAFFCGTFDFPACLTGWVNSFWLSFIVVVLFIIIVVVWERVIGALVFVSRIHLSARSRLFLSFEQVTLFSVMSTFFRVIRRLGLGPSAFMFAASWLTLFTCSSSGASKTFGSNYLSRCVINVLTCHFPIEPDLLKPSGVEAFWHI